MRKTAMTTLTRAYLLFGFLLAAVFLVTVGPYLANQALNVWMAFGVGIAFVAYGRSNVRRPRIAVACIALGTLWISALMITIFGVAEL